MEIGISKLYRLFLVYIFYSSIKEPPDENKISNNRCWVKTLPWSSTKYSSSFYLIVFLGVTLLATPEGAEAGFGDMLKDWVIDLAKDVGLTVYPYTHYCGLQSEDESRPPESKIDKCCFYHDQCTEYAIAAETTRYGIYNEHSYPIHPCDCNDNFTSCLMAIDTVNAGLVANFYFDLVDECLMQSDNGSYYLVPQELEDHEEEDSN